MTKFPASTSLILTGLFFGAIVCAAQQPQPAPAPAVTSARTRACSANPVLTLKSNKKRPSKAKHPVPPEPPPACIEVRGEGIEIQELLQTTGREAAWRIGENRASEDTWSYVRYFGPDDLEKFADTKVLLEAVKFSSGKAAVTVRTTDIGEGYVRVQISTHFLGEGKSTDAVSGQPSSTWPLNSKGVLEEELISALRTRYKPMD